MKNKGFTLIELMVVISIVALLSAVIMASLVDARARGRDAARIRSMIEVRNALNIYFSEKDGYPTGSQRLGGGTGSSLDILLTPTYIKTINPEIVYTGIGPCSTTCAGYNLGISLEKTNSALQSDKDTNRNSGTNFDGVSSAPFCAIDITKTVVNDPGDLCFDFAN